MVAPITIAVQVLTKDVNKKMQSSVFTPLQAKAPVKNSSALIKSDHPDLWWFSKLRSQVLPFHSMETKIRLIIVICALTQESCTFAKILSEMNITERIEEYGYPVETHEIQTQDDYLLGVFRIPHGKNNKGSAQANRYPILLHHGMLGSAENFIVLDPSRSLGYILADNGYDVWIMSARGAWHSRKHKRLDPDKDKDFWLFTWHEIGVYDIPATIDYILNRTKEKSIHYIGHSQGTTTLFVMGSEKPHYNDKIKLMIALAPSAVLQNARMPTIKLLAPLRKTLEKIAYRSNILELPPKFLSAQLIRNLFGGPKGICSQNEVMANMCKFILTTLVGLKQDLFDWDQLPVLLALSPSQCATFQALHYAQVVQTGKFEQFDWGVKENERRYGSKVPSAYDFGKITFPVALFFAENDTICTKEDVKVVASLFPNLVENYQVPDTRFGHLEFITGNNLDVVVNQKVLDVLEKYNGR